MENTMGKKFHAVKSFKILLNRPIEDEFISSHDNWRESTASNKGRLRKGMRMEMRTEKESPETDKSINRWIYLRSNFLFDHEITRLHRLC